MGPPSPGNLAGQFSSGVLQEEALHQTSRGFCSSSEVGKWPSRPVKFLTAVKLRWGWGGRPGRLQCLLLACSWFSLPACPQKGEGGGIGERSLFRDRLGGEEPFPLATPLVKGAGWGGAGGRQLSLLLLCRSLAGPPRFLCDLLGFLICLFPPSSLPLCAQRIAIQKLPHLKLHRNQLRTALNLQFVFQNLV